MVLFGLNTQATSRFTVCPVPRCSPRGMPENIGNKCWEGIRRPRPPLPALTQSLAQQTNAANKTEPKPNPTDPVNPSPHEQMGRDPAKVLQRKVRGWKRTHPAKMAVNKTKTWFQSILYVLLCVFVLSWNKLLFQLISSG